MKLQLIFGFLILFLGTVVQACAQQEEHAPFPATQLAENLRAIQVQEHVYVIEHRFPWPCNSMVVFLDSSKVLIADTPCCPEAMGLVLDWINEQVADPDITVINTHYHIDCLGGNELLVERGITVYGSDATMQLIDEKNDATEEEHNLFTSIEDPAIRAFYENFTPVHPNHVFLLNEGLRFTLAGTPVEVHYPGHAHTIDNVIVYLPTLQVMFGGCMIRAWRGTGYMAESDAALWLDALNFVDGFEFDLLIPGHGGENVRFGREQIEITRTSMRNWLEEHH